MYSSDWNFPSFRNVSRFIDARLQAVSSKNMYSEHGFDPRISPSSGHVPCVPSIMELDAGSAQAHAACPTSCHKSRALMVWHLPSVRRIKSQSSSSSTAFKNASVTQLSCWSFDETDAYASGSQSVLYVGIQLMCIPDAHNPKRVLHMSLESTFSPHEWLFSVCHSWQDQPHLLCCRPMRGLPRRFHSTLFVHF